MPRADVGYQPLALQPADLLEGIVAVGPHLGQVEGIDSVPLGLLERHDQYHERPAGKVPRLIASKRSRR
jgi:hypothetical protein